MKLSIMHQKNMQGDHCIVIDPGSECEWSLVVGNFIEEIKIFLGGSPFWITGLTLGTPSHFHDLKTVTNVEVLQNALVKHLKCLREAEADAEQVQHLNAAKACALSPKSGVSPGGNSPFVIFQYDASKSAFHTHNKVSAHNGSPPVTAR